MEQVEEIKGTLSEENQNQESESKEPNALILSDSWGKIEI